MTPAALDRHTLRPAVFLGRRVLMNPKPGRAESDEGRSVATLAPAIRRLNDAGYFVFFVLNEAGVAAGSLTRDEMERRQVRLRLGLRELGARIDDLRACPYHPEATVPSYKRDSDWRIPKPGMIFDLMRYWPIDLERSYVIGDDSDMQAAKAVQIVGCQFEGGDLVNLVEKILRHETTQ